MVGALALARPVVEGLPPQKKRRRLTASGTNESDKSSQFSDDLFDLGAEQRAQQRVDLAETIPQEVASQMKHIAVVFRGKEHPDIGEINAAATACRDPGVPGICKALGRSDVFKQLVKEA
eukprot:8454602-Karenia_brevis.AAC.1